MRGRLRDVDRIPQRPPEAVELNHHHVALVKLDTGTEAQTMGSVKVNVHVSGAAMRLELEMMMFDVGEAVAHAVFAAADLLAPEDAAVPLDGGSATNRAKIRVQRQLRSERARTEF